MTISTMITSYVRRELKFKKPTAHACTVATPIIALNSRIRSYARSMLPGTSIRHTRFQDRNAVQQILVRVEDVVRRIDSGKLHRVCDSEPLQL